MEFHVKSGSPEKQRSACVVIGVFEPRKLSPVGEQLDQVSDGYISNILRRGDLLLDSVRHLCSWKGEEINLTVTEFLLVETLARRLGHVKNRDQLIDAAYGENIYVDDRTIDSHIKRLRRKFKEVDPEFAENVYIV